ncbi:MAG: class I SAM-dependent methyltransferase [Calditrichaeota bacterium]|nr:MAG: class I SAM-dependent methyltransferase [Calditrichota bacterium]
MNYLEINRKLWNEKTDVHYKSDFYNVASFIDGKSSLNSIELDLLGDIQGKSILHLQCHFGMDTISLARLGAEVVGVDLSEKSIEKARELAQKVKTKARFIQCAVYDLEELNEKFDIVFTSYGVLGWLPDMDKWAQIVSCHLKANGQLVMVEFHPVVWIFSYDFTKVEYDYFNTGPIVESIQGTYADKSAPICNDSISWNHSLSEVFSSLQRNGMRIDIFQEYDYSPYNCFERTVEIEKGKYQIQGLEKKIPMLYAVKAKKSIA